MIQFEKRNCPLRKSFKGLAAICKGVDELRSNMQGVYFDGDYMVATDAHLLVKIPLLIYGFDEDEIKYLDGKLIPGGKFTELAKLDRFTVEEDRFVGRDKKEGMVIILFEEVVESFPRYQDLYNEFTMAQTKDLSGISLNAEVLLKAQNAMPCATNIRMDFRGTMEAIVVRPSPFVNEPIPYLDRCVGLVMPCLPK